MTDETAAVPRGAELDGNRRLRSAALDERLATYVPGGVNSNVRLAAPRVFFERGVGARLWDVDGKEYVDYVLGQGPAFLGHAPERVNEAVFRAVRGGMVFGAQSPYEIEAAELFVGALGWPERVRFGVSGTEAVQAALRVARAATGRTAFVRFVGHYHGWLDNVLAEWSTGTAAPASAGQLARALDDSVALPFNDLPALEATLAERGDEIAAVILEPMMFNAGAIEPAPGFLQGVRELCTRHGVVLIFDEVICGFRIAFGGAAERFGVVPDLAVYGKALAGGWPVAALAGRADLLDPIGTARVNHSGTFNASVMAMAAVAATLRLLAEDPPYEQLKRVGSRLIAGLRATAAELDLPLRVQGLPVAFNVSFGPERPATTYADLADDDAARCARLSAALAEAGVWVTSRGIWYLSAAHGEDDVALTLERARSAFAAV